GGQDGAQLVALLAGARVGEAQRTRGADRGAGAAAHTQVGVDDDLLALDLAAAGERGTDLHTGVAAHGLVAAVGADLLLVLEELEFFELAHQIAQADQRGDAGLAVHARGQVEVALRVRVLRKRRLAAQVDHEIEGLLVRRGVALEVDGADGLAGAHAVAVAAAAVEVDLVVQADRTFGAGRHAGVA